MSFYTIDGRFVNKKNVVEGFFDNRVIEYGFVGDEQEPPEETVVTNNSEETAITNNTANSEIVIDNSMEATEDATTMEATEDATTMEATEDATTIETTVEESGDSILNMLGEDTSEPVEESEAVAVAEGANQEPPAEMPMTDEMKEDKSMHMHFCINGKCLTGSELRKLNELYDKKCTN